MNTITINKTEIRIVLDKVSGAKMARVAGELGALQMFQVDRAFREHGQPGEKWQKLAARKESYRYGGAPLQDTGALAASFFIQSKKAGDKVSKSVIASSSFYAPYHQVGFSTKGPNFIPLTLKAKRLHVKGANPREEGLVQGVDYVIAKHGVTVPARPMIDYLDAQNQKEIFETINQALERG